MSWFTNLFGKKSTQASPVFAGAASASSPAYGSVFDSGYIPGKGPKSFDEAMSVAAVFKCARIIGETFGSFKAEYFINEDGEVRPYKESPLYHVIKFEPNPLYSSMTYWETAAMHVAIQGNHFAYHNTDQNGTTISFDLLDPEQMIVFVWDSRIWYRDQSTNTTYSDDEMIHVKGPSKDGIMGMTPLSYVSTSYGAAKEAGEYTESVYQNGAFIGGALETDARMSPEAQAKLAKSWVDKHGTSKKAGGVAVLIDGVKFNPMKVTPADMQIIEMRKYLDSDISGFYRVPLHLLNALERSTNNNIEQQGIDFAMHCMRPYVKRFESEYNRKIVPKNKLGSEFIKFNMESLLRGDSKSRAELHKALYFINSKTPNEIRRDENYGPIENGDETYNETLTRLGMSEKNAGENGKQNQSTQGA